MSKGGGQENIKPKRERERDADRQQFLSALRVHPTKIHSIYLTRADSSKKKKLRRKKKRVKSKPQNGAPVIEARRPGFGN